MKGRLNCAVRLYKVKIPAEAWWYTPITLVLRCKLEIGF